MPITIDLSGRTALVTGGARGIGLTTATTLADAGARVLVADLDSGEAGSWAPPWSPDVSGSLASVRLDVTDRPAATTILSELAAADWFPDIVVNNAGVPSRVGGNPFTRQPVDDWRRSYEINTIGTVNVCAAWTAAWSGRTGGVIVNVSSVAGRKPAPTDPAYSAAKAAVISFTQALAAELAPTVRVCAVCPGMVDTAFQQQVYERTRAIDTAVADEDPADFFRRRAQAFIPLGQAQSPQDIAYAVAFLCSDLAGSITGQALNVDGGFVMS